jgi:hypothetical protein
VAREADRRSQVTVAVERPAQQVEPEAAEPTEHIFGLLDLAESVYQNLSGY